MEKQKICRLRDIYRAIAGLEEQIEKTFGLNINEAMLLCTLKDHADMKSSEIADALNLTHSNASKVIASVEDMRLVRRSVDKQDKRQMRFALTKQGMEKLDMLNCEAIELSPILQGVCGE